MSVSVTMLIHVISMTTFNNSKYKVMCVTIGNCTETWKYAHRVTKHFFADKTKSYACV